MSKLLNVRLTYTRPVLFLQLLISAASFKFFQDAKLQTSFPRPWAVYPLVSVCWATLEPACGSNN